MKDAKKVSLLVVAFIFVSYVIINSMGKDWFVISAIEKTRPLEFHTPKEIQSLKKILGDRGSILDQGEYFIHSYNCTGCHGYDSLQQYNIDANGNDVNLVDDWKSTMMALSAKDPFWRAKVSHEILVNPGISMEIQNKCTSCHAPMGHYNAIFNGASHYTLNDLYNDSLGLDGVACVACHTIGTDGLGSSFSGHIPYDTLFQIYGPFLDPLTGPMQLYTGYTPVHSNHVSQGKFCSPCHTLITESVDLSGVPTGKSFVEQATYHEWVNSNYFQDEISCQRCHMPKIEDSVQIANQFFGIDYRSPFNLHTFQGSNAFMLKLMKENKVALNVDVPDANFDSSIAVTIKTLQQQTLEIDLLMDVVESDTAYFSVKLTNKAGHKFPSGYPSRRAVLQFLLIGQGNDTLFASGLFDQDFEVQHINPSFEPHHDVIADDNRSQIYEMVMGDVNGDKTTVLMRADTMLKDNRLTPQGFTTTSTVYDTTRIILGTPDDDFNLFPNGNEGSGTDITQYRVPLNGYSQPFAVFAKVYYQAVPPGYLTEMFSHSSAEIDQFKNMYNAADKTPVLVIEDSLTQLVLGKEETNLPELKVYPDPTADGNISVSWGDQLIDKVYLYDLRGRLLGSYDNYDQQHLLQLQLPQQKATYILEIRSKNHRQTKKVIRQ
jgi:hypothetical protein